LFELGEQLVEAVPGEAVGENMHSRGCGALEQLLARHSSGMLRQSPTARRAAPEDQQRHDGDWDEGRLEFLDA
jgi:hypothetical protein